MRRRIGVVSGTLIALVCAGHMVAAQTAARDVWLRVSGAGDDRAVIGASVTIDGTALAKTDSGGVTRVRKIRPGMHALQVSAIGYKAVARVLEIAPEGPDTIQCLMEPTVTRLNTINVRTKAVEPRMADFERRRIRGFGRFLDRAQLDSSRGQSLESVLRARSGALFISGPNGAQYLVVQSAPPKINGGGGICVATVYLDGTRMNLTPTGVRSYLLDPTAPDLRHVLVDDLEAVEYYPQASFLPIELRDGASLCGVLVMWTRGNH